MSEKDDYTNSEIEKGMDEEYQIQGEEMEQSQAENEEGEDGEDKEDEVPEYSPPISALPPRVLLQEEGQIEVSASPAFQCLDDVSID